MLLRSGSIKSVPQTLEKIVTQIQKFYTDLRFSGTLRIFPSYGETDSVDPTFCQGMGSTKGQHRETLMTPWERK